MLRFAVRRLRVQRRMVAAVVVLVAIATTQLGIATLLLGATQERAFASAVARSQPQEVDVTAFLVDLDGADLESARAEAREVVGDVLAPMDPTLTSTASSQMRELDDDRLGYLATSDAFAQRADLTSGRWPRGQGARGPVEAVLPDATANRLDLDLGDRVTLGAEIGMGGVDNAVRLVVVGTFRPRPRAGWDGDRLGGAGFDPAYSDGTRTAAAYGPFVVDDASFLATGSAVSGLRVTAHPDLGLADDAALRTAVAALDSASALLSARVGDRVGITRVASDLALTVDRLDAERTTARSTVLVVLLLGTTMSLASLLLAGRMVAGVRDDERALLVRLGLGRGQQLRTALLEGALMAVVAALLAVPGAALLHSWLTHLPALRAAGVTQGPTVTWELASAGLAGAVLMTGALVLPALDLAPTAAPGRWRAAARSGVDVLLLVAVVGAGWQLRTQPATVRTGGDTTLTVAPALFILALVLLLVRGVPLLLGFVARVGARSRKLVLPLAAIQAARRPESVAAMVLLATAAAAATFGTALHATWERSQEDQADLRVGTDLALALPATAGPGEAAAVVAATSGTGSSAVSAVARRPLALGRYVGADGTPPVLVAVDSRHADVLLRGRLDGTRSWATVGAELTAGPEVSGVPVPEGLSGIELEGAAAGGTTLLVTPTVVVEDATGFRSAVSAEPVLVDGAPHPVRWQSAPGSGRLVALRLQVSDAPGEEPQEGIDGVSVALRIPSEQPSVGASDWEVRALGQHSPVRGASSISLDATGDGVVLRTSARLDLTYLAYTGADLLATTFAAPSAVPVAVSQQLADAVGAEVGGEISANVGQTVIPLRVTAVVPTIPSVPGRVAVLADIDTLSRALIHAGRLDSVVDSWWVAEPSSQTERAVRELELGDVTTRNDVAAQLARGPMRVTVPATLLVLVVTAALLLLAGAGLVVSGDQRQRAAEVARLRALGLTRRETARVLLAEHGSVLVLLVSLGVAAGAVASVAIGPGLVRSDLGVAPVPPAAVVWPWASELAVVGGLLLACVVVVRVVTAARVRRSDLAQLRTGES
jgi:hypothetical protein